MERSVNKECHKEHGIGPQDQHINPLPLMSKGEENQKGRLKGKKRKCISINAKGGDYWKCYH